MPTTSNFGWTTPADTDLVKDGAAAIRTLGNGIDTSFLDLKGGTSGQILAKNSNTDLDFVWIANDQGDITAVTAGTGISGGGTSGAVTITNDMATTITASGDIVIGTGSGTYDNLPIGSTGQVLTADTSVSPYKVKWATAGGAGWSVVNQSAIAYNRITTASGYLNGTWIIGGDAGALATSTDGATWTSRTSGTSNTIRTFATSGSVYVLGGDSAMIRSATDPTSTWTNRTSNLNGWVSQIIWDGAKFIAISTDTGATNKVSTSTDGTTWTARYTGAQAFYGVANNGTSNYVAVGYSNGSDSVYITSTNGTSWTLTTVASGGTMLDVIWNGTNFVILGVDQGEEFYKIYTLTTGGTLTQVGKIENESWVGASQTASSNLLWDGTNYWITSGFGHVYKGGSNYRFQKYSTGFEPYLDLLNQPKIAYNAGNYLGAGGWGIIMYGTEPRV